MEMRKKMTIIKSDVFSKVISNKILEDLTWKEPSHGHVTNSVGPEIDQFRSRLPMMAIPSAELQIERVYRSNTNCFLDDGGQLNTVDLVLADGADENKKTTTLFGMKSIAAKLEISSSSLGVEQTESIIGEFSQMLEKVLERAFSVALIYGGWKSVTEDWFYYNSWLSPNAFPGFVALCQSNYDKPNNGYREDVGESLSLAMLDGFMGRFKGSNQALSDTEPVEMGRLPWNCSLEGKNQSCKSKNSFENL